MWHIFDFINSEHLQILIEAWSVCGGRRVESGGNRMNSKRHLRHASRCRRCAFCTQRCRTPWLHKDASTCQENQDLQRSFLVRWIVRFGPSHQKRGENALPPPLALSPPLWLVPSPICLVASPSSPHSLPPRCCCPSPLLAVPCLARCHVRLSAHGASHISLRFSVAAAQ
jgi:hypothetical protein